ncbi:hypothetical protein M0R45_019408 [Rubus argutus]|uniref:Uncharacterized protein n=1 Tax=Rubus argutus TaxID=59490 RepID=A0AAW1X901_RUBAR
MEAILFLTIFDMGLLYFLEIGSTVYIGALGSGDELQIGYCDLLVAVNLQVIGREHGGGRDDSSDEQRNSGVGLPASVGGFGCCGCAGGAEVVRMVGIGDLDVMVVVELTAAIGSGTG